MRTEPMITGSDAPCPPDSRPARRHWLRTALGVGFVAAAGRSFADDNTMERLATPLLQWQERVLLGFGTTLWLRAAHRDAQVLTRGLDAAVASVRQVESLMSLFEPTSQVCRLNEAGALDDPHADLVAVLKLCLEVARRSDGAFDPTVQPLWKLWDSAREQGRQPRSAEITAARASIGWQRLHVSDERVAFAGPGMAITLNGIAQGHAADRAKQVLIEHGIEHALLDTGEWAALGSDPKAGPWALGVEDPRRADRVIATLLADGRALAASSDAYYTFTSDHLHHHILDPRTGDSPPGLATVVVAAESGAFADAFTKVLFMAGPVQALPTARRFGVDAFIIDKQGRWQASEGLRLAAG